MPKKKLTAQQTRRWIDYNFRLFDKMNKANPYIIGFDFSLTSTGYVVISSKTGELVDKGTIKTATTDGTLRERLFKISKEFQSLIKKYPASVIGYEMISVFSNPQSALKLMMVLGLMYTCVSGQKGSPPYILSLAATSLKKAATGNGMSDKNLILKAVYMKWGIDLDSDDIADAFIVSKVAFEAGKVLEIYSKLRDSSGKDLDAFLLDISKGRVDGLMEELDKANISAPMYEVVVSLMTSDNSARENDYEFYNTARQEIVQ